MQHEQASGINFFQRYLTVWVLLCMIVGVAIGHFLPSVPAFLSTLQVDSISIPIAILIWLMIYPMMMKVDFQSVKAALFGVTSPAALATTVGVLTEVPVMLTLVRIANASRQHFRN